MSWAQVSGNTEFWRPGATWGAGHLTQLSAADEQLIRDTFEALYNGSPKAAEALELAAAVQLQIGQASAEDLAFESTVDGNIGYNIGDPD